MSFSSYVDKDYKHGNHISSIFQAYFKLKHLVYYIKLSELKYLVLLHFIELTLSMMRRFVQLLTAT